MQQRARQQQAAVGRRIKPRVEISGLHHIGRMHQQAAHKAVVHALGRRDHPELPAVNFQHLPADGPVILVLYRFHHLLDPCPGLVQCNGGGGHQVADPEIIIFSRQADAVHRHLGCPPVLGGKAGDPGHLAHIPLADGPCIVPHLGRDAAAAVGQIQRQKGLSRRRGALGNVLEDVVSLKLVAGVHIVYQHGLLSFITST